MGASLCTRRLEGVVTMLTQEGTGCIPGLECGQARSVPGGRSTGILISWSPVDQNPVFGAHGIKDRLKQVAGPSKSTHERLSFSRRWTISFLLFWAASKTVRLREYLLASRRVLEYYGSILLWGSGNDTEVAKRLRDAFHFACSLSRATSRLNPLAEDPAGRTSLRKQDVVSRVARECYGLEHRPTVAGDAGVSPAGQPCRCVETYAAPARSDAFYGT